MPPSSTAFVVRSSLVIGTTVLAFCYWGPVAAKMVLAVHGVSLVLSMLPSKASKKKQRPAPAVKSSTDRKGILKQPRLGADPASAALTKTPEEIAADKARARKRLADDQARANEWAQQRAKKRAAIAAAKRERKRSDAAIALGHYM